MFDTSKVFISYRRSDAERTARALCETLRARFGAERVFFDTSDIPYGEDFARVVHQRIAASDVVIAVIGPTWLSTANAAGRRLDQADDPVRFELTSALQLAKRIVPVRVDGAAAPSAADLPEPLRALAVLNMPELRLASFDIDVAELERQLLGLPKPDIGFAARLAAIVKGGPAAVALLVALVLGATWSGLFDLLGLQTQAQRLLLRAAALGDAATPVLLVTIDAASEAALGREFSAANAAAWRRDHARLIQRAARAGASAVAFDLFFESPSDADAMLADAARHAAPMRVVVGVRAMRDGQPVMANALRDATAWGSLCLTERGNGALWSAPLAVLRPALGAGGELIGAETPALALATLVAQPLRSADLGRRELLFDGPPRNPPLRFSSIERQRVDLPGCDTTHAGDDLLMLRLRVASEGYWRRPERSVSYAAALDPAATPDARWRDRIVLVGVTALQRGAARQDVHVVQDLLHQRSVYGVELQADALRTLASGRVPRLPTVDRQLATTLLACVLGAGVAVWGFERSALRRRLVLFAVTLAWLALAWWLARHDLLSDIFDDLITLWLAAAALRVVQVMSLRVQAFRRIGS